MDAFSEKDLEDKVFSNVWKTDFFLSHNNLQRQKDKKKKEEEIKVKRHPGLLH